MSSIKELKREKRCLTPFFSTAAQLRYQQQDGQYVTLYQTNYSPIFVDLPNINNGLTAITTYARGIEVSMWVEKGVVMVTAQSINQSTK